jgi:hypothetical protein
VEEQKSIQALTPHREAQGCKNVTNNWQKKSTRDPPHQFIAPLYSHIKLSTKRQTHDAAETFSNE